MKKKLLPIIFLSVLSAGCYAEKSSDTAGDCDIWAQTCPENQKCTAVGVNDGEGNIDPWSTNLCKSFGSKQLNEECEIKDYFSSGEDNCGKGLFCRTAGADTLKGNCVAFCKGTHDNPECPAAQKCEFYFGEVMPLCIEK